MSDWCRHCTSEGVTLTLEHLPPRAADNADTVHLIDSAGTRLKEFSEGHALPVLCDDCNGGASDRGLPNAYKLWRLEVIEGIKTHTDRSSRGLPYYNIWRTHSAVEIDHGYNLHPGRISRQVLGMLLAVRDEPTLSVSNPQLREAYFSDAAASIAPLRMYLALANTGFGYWTDAVMNVHLNFQTGNSIATSLRVWCFTPFLAMLIEDDSPPPFPALRIDTWLEHPVSYHFRKSDRHVDYPIASRSHVLVSALYGESEI